MTNISPKDPSFSKLRYAYYYTVIKSGSMLFLKIQDPQLKVRSGRHFRNFTFSIKSIDPRNFGLKTPKHETNKTNSIVLKREKNLLSENPYEYLIRTHKKLFLTLHFTNFFSRLNDRVVYSELRYRNEACTINIKLKYHFLPYSICRQWEWVRVWGKVSWIHCAYKCRYFHKKRAERRRQWEGKASVQRIKIRFLKFVKSIQNLKMMIYPK